MLLMEQLKSIKKELGLEKDDKSAVIQRWVRFRVRVGLAGAGEGRQERRHSKVGQGEG